MKNTYHDQWQGIVELWNLCYSRINNVITMMSFKHYLGAAFEIFSKAKRKYQAQEEAN